MIKAFYIFLGSFFLALGIIGIVFPILPTTPFLLLTLYFYARGSNRFHDWFISTKLYKNHLETFAREQSMTRKDKWKLLLFVDAMLLMPFLILGWPWLRVLIIALVAIKYWYFFTKVKTVTP